MKITESQLRRIIREAMRDKKGFWVTYDQLDPDGFGSERKVVGPFPSMDVANATINRIKKKQRGLARNLEVTNSPPREML
jgi:hypothetical protein